LNTLFVLEWGLVSSISDSLKEFFIKEIIFYLARETIAKYLRHNLRIPVGFTEI
jgi:hypothetical protein